MSVLAVLLAVSLSSGNAEFDKVAVEGAQSVAMENAEARIAAAGPAAGRLAQLMLDDARECPDSARAHWATAAQAKESGRSFFKSFLDGDLAAEKARIDARLGLTATPCQICLSKKRVDQAMQKYDAYFAAERQTACERQAKTIAGAVKPTEGEVESKDESTLRSEMTAKVVERQKTFVFEENLKYISETIVDPVIDSAKKEMKRQREYLMRTKCEACAPSALAKEIEANLRKNVADRQSREPDPSMAWGVFPKTLAEGLPATVERRTIERVVKNVDDVGVPMDGETILKTISADIAAHRKADDSEKIFRTVFAAQVLDGALEKSSAEAPAKERQEFADYVRGHVTAPELARAIETRIRREILPKWREVRKAVAKAESDRIWPTLADRTWYPAAELADEIAARSDYQTALKEWRKNPDLATLAQADGGRPLMEETEADADKSVAAAFDLARSAISAQNALVDEAEPCVLVEARDRKSSFWRSTPDLKAIVAMLTEAVETRWAERRLTTLWGDGARPANAAEQHSALFPSVKRHIELVARSILEQMEEPEPKPDKEPESEETSEEPLVKYSIVVERNGDEVMVKLDQGPSTIAERRAKAKMSDYRDAMKFVSDKLGSDILRLK